MQDPNTTIFRSSKVKTTIWTPWTPRVVDATKELLVNHVDAGAETTGGGYKYMTKELLDELKQRVELDNLDETEEAALRKEMKQNNASGKR